MNYRALITVIIAKSPEYVTANFGTCDNQFGVNCHIFTILFKIK